MITKVRERLVVSKEVEQRLEVERFNLKKVGELETISDKDLKSLENLHERKDTNRAWENIKRNKKKNSSKQSLCLYEWMQHKP